MDKDNRDDFTFAKLSDLKMPVTFRMYLSPYVVTPGLALTRLYSTAHGA